MVKMMCESDSIRNQEICRKLVDREIIACQSSLVDMLLREGPFNYEDVENLVVDHSDEIESLREESNELLEEKYELESELEDDDEQEDEEDKMLKSDREDKQTRIDDITNRCEEIEEEIEELLNRDDYNEVYEWYLVSNWMLEKLRAKGEPILDTEYESWWGRCTSGQAILLDGVIQEIASDMEILVGQKNEWK